jgi:serine/threonine-protein kinase
MLVGQQPFFGPDVNTILHQVMNGEPPRLSPELARLLPGDVEQVLRKALSKRQQDRFPTITAFAKALEAAAPLDTPMVPVKPKAPPKESLFVKPARRPPTPATLPAVRARRRLVWVGAAAVAAAIGIGVALFQSGQLPFAPAGAAGAAPAKDEAPSGPTVVPMHAGKPAEKADRKRRRVAPER